MHLRFPIYLAFGVLPGFNLNSCASHLLYKKSVSTIGNINQNKKIKMAHTLSRDETGGNILVYFLLVCFQDDRTVHTSL